MKKTTWIVVIVALVLLTPLLLVSVGTLFLAMGRPIARPINSGVAATSAPQTVEQPAHVEDRSVVPAW